MTDLVNGLGGAAGFGENSVSRNDDGFSAAIDIRSVFGASGLNYFGQNFTTIFVNTNGNITFGAGLSSYIPDPIGTNLHFPIIAAYWMDLDTRNGNLGRANATPGGTSTGSNLVYYDLDAVNHVFTATWDDVGYYSQHTDALNAFQIQLIQTGPSDFDIVFRYEAINQATSDTNDPGEAARAGFSGGNGTGYEIQGSGDENQILTLDTAPGNTGTAGLWLFHVHGGVVSGDLGNGLGGDAADPPVPLGPVSFTVSAPWQFEGNVGHTGFDVVIRRSGADLSVGSAVNWEFTTPDVADFAPGQAFAGVAEFGPGQTEVVVTLEVVADRVAEPDDYFNFVLSNVTHGDAAWNPRASTTGVIMNDDRPVNFDFSGPLMRMEGSTGSTPFEFLVMRSGDLAEASSVHWVMQPGTADSLDFAPGQALSGDVAFLSGQSQATISIAVAGDTRTELDETFSVQLTAATTGGARAMPLDVATTGTILDDDLPLSRLVGSPTVLVMPEGDSGLTNFTFSIMRVGDTSAAASTPFTISLPALGGVSAGEIQSALAGTVSFAAGAISATLTVQVAGDLVPEADESFLITLGGGVFNTLTLTGVVMNDDRTSAAAAPGVLGAPLEGEGSSFMAHMTGGGLWSDGPLA